ncbi:MAG: GAF domain-containing protein, partial [Rhodococcus sp. (in: high G+C Gram-positive bacteria)]|uniref:GAF domain-containing protein n=1 Tax=Rhodococcus sp. TaxID=1831 RepID=UPI003BB04604
MSNAIPMSNAVPLPGNRRPADTAPHPHRDDIRACTAFREVAEALAEGRDLDAVLHLIAEKLSHLTGADRCSIHLVDKETGLLHGRAAHAPTNIDAQVKQLVSGTMQDSFTREILTTRRPVALLNTLSDPRPIKSAMRRWNTQSVLGVPMVLRDEVIGIVYLDSENTSVEFSAADQELAVAFADLAATAIRQTQLTTRLRSSLSTVATQIEQLRQAASLEEQLTEIVLRGSSLREIGDTVSRLLGKPCAIYDSAFRLLVLSSPAQPGREFTPRLLDKDIREAPAVVDVLKQLKPGTPTVIQPLPWLGLHHRLLVCAVMVEGGCWGYVVVAEHGRRLSPLDEAVVRRAALNIALERSGERRAGDVQWHTIEAFTGSLLRGDESVAALEKRAEVLG